MPTLQIYDLERQDGAVVDPRVVLPMLGEHTIQALMRRLVIRAFRIPFLALLAMALLSTPGIACRPAPPSETVLLETLPAEAEESAVIARVVVIDVYDEPPRGAPRTYATARVIEATKGVEAGQVIRIKAGPYPCTFMLNVRDIGRGGLIAGEFNSNQDFVGFWDRRYARKKGGG